MTYQPALDLDQPGNETPKDWMGWWDNSKEPLQTKIQRAANYYEKKNGVSPKIARVHPNTSPPTDWAAMAAMGIIIKFEKIVLIDHIYLGLE